MTRKLTNQEFLQRLSKVNSDVIPLEEYVGGERKIKVTYKSCGHTEYKMARGLLKGRKCNHAECFNKRLSKTKLEEGKNRNVAKLKDMGIVLLESYKGIKDKTKILNTNCNHEYEVSLGNVLQGSGCPTCYGYRDTNSFIKLINKKYPDQYEIFGEYVDTLTPISVKHLECGYKWDIRPKDLLKDERCPNCITSKGERYVKRYLVSLGINFKMQYRFADCRNVNPLPFDFAIFVNGNIGLIEFDGSQHFGYSRFWGRENGYQEVSANDEIKNQYCNDNDIPLLRIPYWWIRNDRAIREIDQFINLVSKQNNFQQLALTL